LSEDQLAQKFSKIKLGKVAFKTDDPALTTLSKKEAGKIELIQKQVWKRKKMNFKIGIIFLKNTISTKR